MADLTMKTDDTRPEFACVLKDQNGVRDISAATAVRLILARTSPASPAVVVTGTCTKITISAAIAAGLMSSQDTSVTPPVAWSAGELATVCVARYAWIAADTSNPGDYNGEVEVTTGAGIVQTFPSDGYFTVTFRADLD